MSAIQTYACNVKGCQQMSQNAIGYDFFEDNKDWILRFSVHPENFDHHACSFKHLVEMVAQETDKILIGASTTS